MSTKAEKTIRERYAEKKGQVEDQANLAANIRKISAGMTALTSSGLNRKAVIVLLQDRTKVARGLIEAVLDGLNDLAKTYTS